MDRIACLHRGKCSPTDGVVQWPTRPMRVGSPELFRESNRLISMVPPGCRLGYGALWLGADNDAGSFRVAVP